MLKTAFKPHAFSSVGVKSSVRNVSRYQRAAFWRGGTSNGIMISGSSLREWQRIKSSYADISKIDLQRCAEILGPFFNAAMGSPDSYGRQLNGMGGGLSSLSKAVVVDKSTDSGADIDYLFVQIGIKDGKLDLAGNCGNMTSAVGPFAIEERSVTLSDLDTDRRQRLDNKNELSLTLRNLNTGKLIESTFNVASSAKGIDFIEQGSYIMSGVSQPASSITLSFLSPSGSKTGKTFPTGQKTDILRLPTGEVITATLSDVSSPTVFVDGLQLTDRALTPDELTADTTLLDKLEHLRQSGARLMGLNPETPSLPKIVMLFPATDGSTDIVCRAISMGQPHRAVPMTVALNLGVTSCIPGTLMERMIGGRTGETVVIGHPGGSVEVGARLDGEKVVAAEIVRTARCLMRGEVNATLAED